MFTVLLMAMFAATVNGQSIVNPLKVNIPFDFSVYATTLHQGEYTVSTLNANGAVVLRGPQDSVVVLTISADKGVGKDSDKLVFHRVNGVYFLASIWTVANPVGYILPTSRQEREMIAEGGKPELKVLIASTN